jgi:acyl-CoA thioester hydrolase
MTIVRASVQGAAEAQSYQDWTSVTLRFGDTDQLGHVNNAVYATLFESGRCDFCLGLFQTANESGRLFTLARVAIDFVQEMHFPGDARVGTRVLAVGKSSFTLGQAIFKDGVCHSVADSVLVLIDQKTRRSTPLTAELLDMIKSLRRSD